MRGHEFVREAVRTYLETEVPVRLAAHLAANGLTSPSTDIAFLLQDVLEGVESFPAVLVKSTNGNAEKWVGPRTYWYAYDLELVVACDHRVHGSYEAASTDRDRLLLAVRESVLTMSGLPDDIDLQAGQWPEETGAAVQTLAGVPLAAGTLKFTVRLVETVADLDPPEDMDAADLTVTGIDADTDLD
ncbi:MAG: hypothetical protein R2686_07145 [Candidatus Nanopelagicales bacterium]